MEKIINKKKLFCIVIMFTCNVLFSQYNTNDITIVFYRNIVRASLELPIFAEKEKFSFEYQSDTLFCFVQIKSDTVCLRGDTIVYSNVRQIIKKYKAHPIVISIPFEKEFKEFVLYYDERIYYFKQNIKDKDVFDLYKMDKK